MMSSSLLDFASKATYSRENKTKQRKMEEKRKHDEENKVRDFNSELVFKTLVDSLYSISKLFHWSVFACVLCVYYNARDFYFGRGSVNSPFTILTASIYL